MFIDVNGDKKGVVFISEVLVVVLVVDFDLVEVLLDVKLLVIKIFDYGKYKY